MGKEENEAREKARRDKNVKKWKQNTDRWAKWKVEKYSKARNDRVDAMWAERPVGDNKKTVKEDKDLDKGMAKWWKSGYKAYHSAAKKKPLPEPKEKEVKEETDKDRYLGKSYKHSRDKIHKKQEISDAKAGLRMANLTSKAKLQNLRNVPVKEETKFTLPEKYGGEYSVRKIYKDDN